MDSIVMRSIDKYIGESYNSMDGVEKMGVYERLALSLQDPSKAMHLSVSMKNDWFNKHLVKFGMETRSVLQDHLKAKCAGVLVGGEALDRELLSTVVQQPAVATGLFKDLLYLTVRYAQWVDVVSKYMNNTMEKLNNIYMDMESNMRVEMNNKLKMHQNKISTLEKLMKSIKETPLNDGHGSTGKSGKAGTVPKLEKEVERLKVRIIALESQNAFMVSRERALETKMKENATTPSETKKEKEGTKDLKKKKESKDLSSHKHSSASMDTKNSVMVFENSDYGNNLQSKKLSAPLNKKVKKVTKLEKLDRYETALMDYCSILNIVILTECSNGLPGKLLDANVYQSFMELVIDILPKIDKRKELLADRSGFLKGILELAVRCIDAKKKVRFSEEQMMVCVPDVLPINFHAKTSFWIKVLDPKHSIVPSLADDTKEPKPCKFVVQEQVTKSLQSILTNFVNYLRLKLSELGEKAANLRSGGGEAVSGTPTKSIEVKQSFKKLLEIIHQRSQYTKTLVLCYVFIERSSSISEEQQIYYTEEISELLAERHWRDLPSMLEDIRQWYGRLVYV